MIEVISETNVFAPFAPPVDIKSKALGILVGMGCVLLGQQSNEISLYVCVQVPAKKVPDLVHTLVFLAQGAVDFDILQAFDFLNELI